MKESGSTVGLPDDIKDAPPLWELAQSATPSRPESRTRLYADGRMYVWSNSRRTLVDGKPRRENANYAWRLDALVSPEGVAKIRQLIKDSFEPLAAPEQAAQGADQGTTTWQSNRDGTVHTLTLPSSARDKLPQALRDIDYAIQSSIVPGGVPIEQ
jgi:hypothetical protein